METGQLVQTAFCGVLVEEASSPGPRHQSPLVAVVVSDEQVVLFRLLQAAGRLQRARNPRRLNPFPSCLNLPTTGTKLK